MKKLIMAAALAAAAGAALADDLADGIKAWEAQDFAKAHQLLGKAAAAGNPEAQLMVGEMYGFGEGVPEDAATAESWIRKAQAGGHKDAAESLNTLKQRGAHKQDIAYYISGYKGDEVRLEKYGCVKPVIPPVSGRSNPTIIRIVVDLPAPLGPRKPVTTPGSTVKLRSSTAVWAP